MSWHALSMTVVICNMSRHSWTVSFTYGLALQFDYIIKSDRVSDYNQLSPDDLKMVDP